MSKLQEPNNVDSIGKSSSILTKAQTILEAHELDITKDWLRRLIGQMDDMESLKHFPTQESIRTSAALIEGLANALVDESVLAEFEEGGDYYRLAETLGLLQRRSDEALFLLSDSLRTLEDSVWEHLSQGLRQQDRELLQLVQVLRLGLHRILTAAAAAYHKQASTELHRLAHTDTLTGLYNRRYWEPELLRHVELYKRYERPFAVLMIDFDNLKWVNDTFGHAAGDTALIHLATVMRTNIRDVDIPCRFGGDEFTVLVPEARTNAAEAVGARISESVNKTRFKLGKSFATLQISYGYAACPDDGIDADTLLREADVSLYQAKQRKTTAEAIQESPATF